MKTITKEQLRKIINEEIGVIPYDTIEDRVMKVLSDEGGAAGTDPIEDELEDLEDDEASLPDEPIEDIIARVPGVKRHADGDFIDTTQLENKMTMGQLKQIILEEKEALIQEGYFKELYGEIQNDVYANLSSRVAAFSIDDAVEYLTTNRAFVGEMFRNPAIRRLVTDEVATMVGDMADSGMVEEIRDGLFSHID